MRHHCLECKEQIPPVVYEYSTENFGVPLCRDCQVWLRDLPETTTNEALDLYFELKMLGVPAILEDYDGYKHVDISIPSAKVHIEVDGNYHRSDSMQALSDLKRTYYSFKKSGYLTLRVPNTLVQDHLEEAADFIADFILENQKRIAPNRWRFKRR